MLKPTVVYCILGPSIYGTAVTNLYILKSMRANGSVYVLANRQVVSGECLTICSGQLKVILCLGAPFPTSNCACWTKNKHDGYHILHTLTKSYSRQITKLCIAVSLSDILDFGQGYDIWSENRNFYIIQKSSNNGKKSCESVKTSAPAVCWKPFFKLK